MQAGILNGDLLLGKGDCVMQAGILNGDLLLGKGDCLMQPSLFKGDFLIFPFSVRDLHEYVGRGKVCVAGVPNYFHRNNPSHQMQSYAKSLSL